MEEYPARVTTHPPVNTSWIHQCENYFANSIHLTVMMPPDAVRGCLQWGEKLHWDWPRFEAGCNAVKRGTTKPIRSIKFYLAALDTYLPPPSTWSLWLLDHQAQWPRRWTAAMIERYLPAAMMSAAQQGWDLTPQEPRDQRRMRMLLTQVMHDAMQEGAPIDDTG